MSVPDRRPWLIISRAEAIALENAVLAGLAQGIGLRAAPDLVRALRVIDSQLRYIQGAADGVVPSVAEAVLREAGLWDA